MTPDHTACTLALDRLRVRLDCAAPGVIDYLRPRYQAFLVDDATADCTLAIAKPEWRERPGLPRDFEFRSRRLTFTSTGYRGDIDLSAQRATLHLSTLHLFEDIDYAVRAIFALLAFEAGGLLFHAAGLKRQGCGYAFFGYSGSGKTTVSRVSRDAVVLNDDLILLLPTADGWRMAATPFSNPTQFAPSGPLHVALHGLYRLVQDRRVFAEDLPIGSAVAEIVASAPIVSADPARTIDLLARALQLAQSVPVRRLHFLPDDSFWSVIS